MQKIKRFHRLKMVKKKSKYLEGREACEGIWNVKCSLIYKELGDEKNYILRTENGSVFFTQFYFFKYIFKIYVYIFLYFLFSV